MAGHYWKYLAVAAMAATLGGIKVRAEAPDATRPALSDLMLLTEFRQIKLWYAERAENWKLASYELDQLGETIRRIASLYPETAGVSQAALIHDRLFPPYPI